MATYDTLPLEIRQEIWRLALLPGPGVYSFNEDDFWRWEFCEDGYGGEGYRNYYPSRRRWLIPKQKRPTVMQLNREAREFCYGKMNEERRRTRDGHPHEYWFDKDDRPFMSDMDVFYIDDPKELYQYSIVDRQWTQQWRIKHLALSSKCFDNVLEVTRDEDDLSRRPLRSGWDALQRCLKFFTDLEDISVVFGPNYGGTGQEVVVFDEHSESYSVGWSSTVPDIRLEEWTAGSTEDTEGEVDGLLEKARADLALILQKCARRREEIQRYEESGNEDWGMIGSPWGYYARDLIPRDHVTVHAKRVVKLGDLRGRVTRRR